MNYIYTVKKIITTIFGRQCVKRKDNQGEGKLNAVERLEKQEKRVEIQVYKDTGYKEKGSPRIKLVRAS